MDKIVILDLQDIEPDADIYNKYLEKKEVVKTGPIVVKVNIYSDDDINEGLEAVKDESTYYAKEDTNNAYRKAKFLPLPKTEKCIPISDAKDRDPNDVLFDCSVNNEDNQGEDDISNIRINQGKVMEEDFLEVPPHFKNIKDIDEVYYEAFPDAEIWFTKSPNYNFLQTFLQAHNIKDQLRQARRFHGLTGRNPWKLHQYPYPYSPHYRVFL